MNSTTRLSSIMTPSSMTYITSSLVNCSMPRRPVGSVSGRTAGASANLRFTTSTWSPRFWSKPIAERTRAAMRSSSSLLRSLIDHLALFVLGIAAVDQHRDRDAVDPPGLGHLGLGGAGNLVVVGFLGLLALVARGRGIVLVLIARQLVVDGDLAAVVGGRRGFFPGLARAQHAAFGIELVRGLGNLVVVEIGRELDAGAARADHRGHDRSRPDCASASRSRRGARPRSVLSASVPVPAPSASNWPASSTIETRCGFRPLTAEATRWRMALICCGSSAPRTRTTIEADGSGVSRENSGRSGSTRWTRAAWMRSMARMVRASSPSSARR